MNFQEVENDSMLFIIFDPKLLSSCLLDFPQILVISNYIKKFENLSVRRFITK
jgi:hypothetical protein